MPARSGQHGREIRLAFAQVARRDQLRLDHGIGQALLTTRRRDDHFA
jgi:hypothetical protein